MEVYRVNKKTQQIVPRGPPVLIITVSDILFPSLIYSLLMRLSVAQVTSGASAYMYKRCPRNIIINVLPTIIHMSVIMVGQVDDVVFHCDILLVTGAKVTGSHLS